jgi:hypothetical protein
MRRLLAAQQTFLFLADRRRALRRAVQRVVDGVGKIARLEHGAEKLTLGDPTAKIPNNYLEFCFFKKTHS